MGGLKKEEMKRHLSFRGEWVCGWVKKQKRT
jgi:hypothetical protein